MLHCLYEVTSKFTNIKEPGGYANVKNGYCKNKLIKVIPKYYYDNLQDCNTELITSKKRVSIPNYKYMQVIN